jgi:hypothetical protein
MNWSTITEIRLTRMIIFEGMMWLLKAETKNTRNQLYVKKVARFLLDFDAFRNIQERKEITSFLSVDP